MRSQSPQRIAKQVLLGKMLGDGCIIESSHSKAYLQLAHGVAQLDYLLWTMKALFPLIGSFAYSIQRDKPNAKIQGMPRVTAWTLSNKYLHHIYNDFYMMEGGKRKKIVRRNLLNRLSPISLAAWYMDDGTLQNKTIHLYTNGFDNASHANVLEYLKHKWNINGVLDIDKRTGTNQIRFNKDDAKKWIDIVGPYVHPSMAYKIDASLRSEHPEKTDEEIVRTLQECKELVRKYQPIAKQCLSYDEVVQIRNFIVEHWPRVHTVSHWRRKNGLHWFVIYAKNCGSQLLKIKEAFGGSININGKRSLRYQTTLANGIRMMLKVGLVT